MNDEIILRIKQAYAECGNKTAVANQLGIDRKTVRRYVEPPQEPSREDIEQYISFYKSLLRSKSEPTHPVSRHANLEGYKRIVFCFDCHFPYQSQSAIDAVLDFCQDWRPDLFVLGGDTLDCYAISRFDKDPARAHGMQDEIDAAEPTMARIEKVCRDVAWLDGNHEKRITTLVHAHPSLYKLRGFSVPEFLRFPKHWRYYQTQQHIKIGDLICLHGDLAGRNSSSKLPASSMLSKLGTNCIFGHQHRMGMDCSTGYDGQISTAYAVGHLCDPDKMDYIRKPNWQSGFATATLDPKNHAHVQQLFVLDKKIFCNGREFGG